MTSTTTKPLPTWMGPPWATQHTETDAGIRWTRQPTTAVTDYPQPITPEGEPISVEAVEYDFLEVVRAAVIVGPVQINRWLGARPRRGAEPHRRADRAG